MAKNMLDMTAMWLIIIGAINWGLVAFGFNLVETLFGSWPMIVSIIYFLVGASGIYQLWKMFA